MVANSIISYIFPLAILSYEKVEVNIFLTFYKKLKAILSEY